LLVSCFYNTAIKSILTVAWWIAAAAVMDVHDLSKVL